MTTANDSLTMEKMIEALNKIPPAPERKFDGMFLSQDSLTALKELMDMEDVELPYGIGSLCGIDVVIRPFVPFGTAVLWKHGKPLSSLMPVQLGLIIDYSEALPHVVGIVDFTKELQDVYSK